MRKYSHLPVTICQSEVSLFTVILFKYHNAIFKNIHSTLNGIQIQIVNKMLTRNTNSFLLTDFIINFVDSFILYTPRSAPC